MRLRSTAVEFNKQLQTAFVCARVSVSHPSQEGVFLCGNANARGFFVSLMFDAVPSLDSNAPSRACDFTRIIIIILLLIMWFFILKLRLTLSQSPNERYSAVRVRVLSTAQPIISRHDWARWCAMHFNRV